jgi:tetratricopeptide (TPR) repeat protein
MYLSKTTNLDYSINTYVSPSNAKQFAAIRALRPKNSVFLHKMDDNQPRINEIHQARKAMLAGRPEDALARLDAVPDNFATLALVRGECFFVLQRFAEAKREFARCLLLAENSPRAEIMLELASDMIELERTIKPRASIEHLFGERADASGTIPAFHPQIELAPDGIDESETNPSSDEIGFVSETLAELMERQGKFDDARKVYIQLSRLNPDKYEYFRDKINRLLNEKL